MNKIVRGQLSLFEKARSIPQRSISVAAYRGEPYMLQILFMALALCIVAYLYFVGLSIMNVITNREAVAESERLQNETAALEHEYFALSKGITPEAGVALGLVPTKSAKFVHRGGFMAANVTADDL